MKFKKKNPNWDGVIHEHTGRTLSRFIEDPSSPCGFRSEYHTGGTWAPRPHDVTELWMKYYDKHFEPITEPKK